MFYLKGPIIYTSCLFVVLVYHFFGFYYQNLILHENFDFMKLIYHYYFLKFLNFDYPFFILLQLLIIQILIINLTRLENFLGQIAKIIFGFILVLYLFLIGFCQNFRKINFGFGPALTRNFLYFIFLQFLIHIILILFRLFLFLLMCHQKYLF